MVSAFREPHLPPREVMRFGLAVVARLAIAVVLGLVFAKALKLFGGVAVEDALNYGYLAVAAVFAGSFFLRPVDWPEVDFGPEPEHSLLDEGDAAP